VSEKVKAGETKSLVTASEHGDSEITNDDTRSGHQSSIEDDVKSFTAYPLPPSSFLFSNSKLTTNNPLDNLKEFVTWKSSDINDSQGNHENEIEDNESIFIDQLAVESGQNQQSIRAEIVKTDSASSLSLTKIPMSDLESNISSSEHSSEAKANPPSEKFNVIKNNESMKIQTFDTETRRTTTVRISAETTVNPLPEVPTSVATVDTTDPVTEASSTPAYNPSLYLGPVSATVSHRINDEAVSMRTSDTTWYSSQAAGHDENITPGTLSIVEIHAADMSKPETSPQAILDDEDDDRNMTEIPSGVLSSEASPLANDAMAVQDTTEIPPETHQEKYEISSNVTNTENTDTNITAENYLTFPGTVNEDSNDLETMYYSDIYAISTIQPVHEYTFYATTADTGSLREEYELIKQKEKEFNLLKEEIDTSPRNPVITSELYEQVTVIPSYDVHEYIDQDPEDYSPDIESNDKYLVHNTPTPTYPIETETETTNYPSLAESPYKLNPKMDDSSDQSQKIDQFDIASSDSRDTTIANIIMDEDYTTGSSETEASHTKEVINIAYPLLTLMKIKPHSMKLLIKPENFYPNTKVELQYERVRHTHAPLLQHLDNPVREVVTLYGAYQEHELSNLPVGKYIVCGDAQIHGQVFQKNCFETTIFKLDNNELQSGVIVVIVVALLIVCGVIVFAIFHKLVVSKRRNKERELQEKVDQFARKEAELHEAELLASQVIAVSYPDPTEP
jgi:hypothetical protein